MTGRIPARVAKFVAALLASTAVVAIAAGAASAKQVLYNNIPSTLPGSMYTVGNEAFKIDEYGGAIGVPHSIKNPTVTVIMSSKACEIGSQQADSCETPKPKKTVKIPVTLRMYSTVAGFPTGAAGVGAELGKVTTEIKMPYRPSSNDKKCNELFGPGHVATWYDEGQNKCFHGMAFAVKFKLPGLIGPISQSHPSVIVNISYNSTNHGPTPEGPQACSTSFAGCPYDLLDVAITETAENNLTVGTQPTGYFYMKTANPEFISPGEPTLKEECLGTPIGVSNVFSPNNCLGTMHMQPVMRLEA